MILTPVNMLLDMLLADLATTFASGFEDGGLGG